MTVYVVGPHDWSAGQVRTGHDGFVRNIDPLSINPHAIMAVPGFPIDVINVLRVCAIAAGTLAAMQTLIPTVQFGVLMIVGYSAAGCCGEQHSNENNRHRMPITTVHLSALLQ